jgi:DNA polymerase III subunit beta
MGAVTVPARTFADFIKTLQEDKEIHLKADESSKLEIKCGKARCLLLGLPKEDFPVLPDFKEETALEIDGKILGEMIKKTVFSVSTDETRYILNGIFFQIDKGVARMVATDGRRLAYVARPITDKKSAVSVIIPSKAIREMERLLTAEAGEGSVKVSVTENQVAFKAGETVIISRLIEGHFPNYDQVIPKTSDLRVQVAARDFHMLTQRAALGSGERGGAVRYTLEKGSLKAAATAQGRVEVEDELAVDYAGGRLEISFNPQFVLDVLKNVDAGQVLLEFTTALNPGVIRPVGDDQMLSVIMPMRT